MIPKSCRLFGQDHAQNQRESRMVPKSCRLFGQDHAQNQRESRACRFNLVEKRSSRAAGSAGAVMSLQLPAYLKPENGPFGSVVGTWLDFAPSGISTRFFLLMFVIFYTAFQVIAFASVGLNPDLLEVYAWGLHPAAGYYKHPPLGGLMAGAWFSVFPPTDWAFHLLAMANAAVGFYAIDLISRRTLSGDKRITVLLLLLLTPFYQFHGQRFASNQT